MYINSRNTHTKISRNTIMILGYQKLWNIISAQQYVRQWCIKSPRCTASQADRFPHTRHRQCLPGNIIRQHRLVVCCTFNLTNLKYTRVFCFCNFRFSMDYPKRHPGIPFWRRQWWWNIWWRFVFLIQIMKCMSWYRCVLQSVMKDTRYFNLFLSIV